MQNQINYISKLSLFKTKDSLWASSCAVNGTTTGDIGDDVVGGDSGVQPEAM